MSFQRLRPVGGQTWTMLSPGKGSPVRAHLVERLTSDIHIGANSRGCRLERNPEPVKRNDRIVKFPGYCVSARRYDQHAQDANS